MSVRTYLRKLCLYVSFFALLESNLGRNMTLSYWALSMTQKMTFFAGKTRLATDKTKSNVWHSLVLPTFKSDWCLLFALHIANASCCMHAWKITAIKNEFSKDFSLENVPLQKCMKRIKMCTQSSSLLQSSCSHIRAKNLLILLCWV